MQSVSLHVAVPSSPFRFSLGRRVRLHVANANRAFIGRNDEGNVSNTDTSRIAVTRIRELCEGDWSDFSQGDGYFIVSKEISRSRKNARWAVECYLTRRTCQVFRGKCEK